MAFFKFRKGGDEQPTSAAPAAESVEAMRKRARHRLIGAALLVALGVVGFPMLFDSQPRPIAVDIPIEIPDKNRVKPLGNLPIDAPAPQTAGVVGTEVVIAPSASASAVVPAVPVAESVVAAPAASTARPAAKPASAPASTPTKVDAPAPPKQLASVPVAAKADDGSKAQALLDGKVPEAKISGADARFIVQVGAFSDAEKAREARLKLERAGLKTYTQVVEPKEGKRTRVRVGPFVSRQDAENAAEKIKQLDLPASILEL
jgi:DedD protein